MCTKTQASLQVRRSGRSSSGKRNQQRGTRTRTAEVLSAIEVRDLSLSVSLTGKCVHALAETNILFAA